MNKPEHVTVEKKLESTYHELSCKRCGASYIANDANVRDVEQHFFRVHSVCTPADVSPNRITKPAEGAT
jgi:hypothetical protein